MSRSPWDGIRLTSNEAPRLPRPKVISLRKAYRYYSQTAWGYVKWCPNCAGLPYTTIWINPRKHSLSAQQVEAIVAELFKHPEFVRVAGFDATVDLLMALGEVEKGIWAKNKRRLHDEYKTTTYHGKAHGHGEIKVYDKGIEQHKAANEVTRIEQTIKFAYDKRPRLRQFLKNPALAAAAFENVILADLNRLDGRLKIVKLARRIGAQRALRSSLLTPKDKERLRELLRNNIRVDLQGMYLDDLISWLGISAARVHQEPAKAQTVSISISALWHRNTPVCFVFDDLYANTG